MNSTPENTLWTHVLGRAIDDLSHNGKDAEYKQERARMWFTERVRKFPNELCDIPGCDPQMGSFLWICSILSLYPGRIRKALNLPA